MVEIKGKINNTQISVLIDPGATLSYITPGVVESNKIKRMKHAKSWLVQLATGTKRKVVDFISDFEFNLDGQNIKTNLNILSLGSYDMIIGMDWLEGHKEILDFYQRHITIKIIVTLLEQPKVYQNLYQLDKFERCNSRNV